MKTQKTKRAVSLYREVFPTRIRARATAVCTAVNYAANTVVGASFLPMVSGAAVHTFTTCRSRLTHGG